jgi:hypothetical protein
LGRQGVEHQHDTDTRHHRVDDQCVVGPQLETYPGREDAFTALASSHPDVIVPARRLLALAAATGRLPEGPNATVEAAS